jgi:DNA-binding GntR family transcriptional regulator
VFVILTESIVTVVSHFRSILGVRLELSAGSMAGHEQIVHALVENDREKAVALPEAHIWEIGQEFKQFEKKSSLRAEATE